MNEWRKKKGKKSWFVDGINKAILFSRHLLLPEWMNGAERSSSAAGSGMPMRKQLIEGMEWMKLIDGAASGPKGKQINSSSLLFFVNWKRKQSINCGIVGQQLIGLALFLLSLFFVGYGWGPSPLPRANSISSILLIDSIPSLLPFL